MGRQPARTGRGRGRFHGRGRSQNHPNKTKDTTKKDASQLQFVVGTAKQASDFIKIKKYCINSFKMKFKQGIYIATALEEGKEYDFTTEVPPPLILIQETGTDKETLEAQGKNESSRIDYKRKLDKYNEKLEVFADNKYKAYGFLWDKCSSQMKQNIETKQDYHTKIKNDPFELLKNIEILSYNYQESKYEVAIIFDAMKTFITLKQRDDENLLTYLDRFKAAAENLKTQMGSEIKLPKYTQTLEGYDTQQDAQFSKQAFEEFKAFAFLSNSENTKYGSLIKALAQQ